MYNGLTFGLSRLARVVALSAILCVSFEKTLATQLEIHASVSSQASPQLVRIVWVEVVSSTLGKGPDESAADLSVPGSLQLDFEPGSIWKFSVASDDFWSAPKIIAVTEEDQRLQLDLLQTARIEGKVEVDPSEKLLDAIDLRFESPPGSLEEIPRTTTTCPVTNSRFECIVPAARLDLRLRAKGFISHYFWGVELGPRTRRELQAIPLERGASVVGWVDLSAPRASFESVRVELSREISSVLPNEASTQRRKSQVLVASVNERGFYEHTGIPEGLYAITATHPDFAPTRYAPVQVLAGGETELPVLELQPGVDFRLTLQPERAYSDSRWRVQLLRRGEAPGHLEEFADDTASDAGEWSHPDLPPSEYVLRVIDGLQTVWHTEELEILPGAEAMTHRVDLAASELEGRVFLGSEPIAANLFFGGYHGSVRIPTESSEDGAFEVLVPDREHWTIDVYAKSSKAEQRFQDVVPESGRGGVGWIELVIPDTKVIGRVIDVEGQPVEDARVRIAGGSGGLTDRSDSKGEFELHGLRYGDYWLEAKTLVPERYSEVQEITLTEDREIEPIELVVRALRRIEGQVMSPAGRAVVGAKIVGLIEQSGVPIASRVPEASTDLNGVFTLDLPEATAGVQLTVFPPGFAMTQVRIDARSPEPVLIQTEPVGGTLRILHEEGYDLGYLQVFHRFALPFFPYLHNWASLHGNKQGETVNALTVPMAEPGFYVACRDLDGEAQMTGLRRHQPESHCVEGVLAPFSELELRLPIPGSSRESELSER